MSNTLSKETETQKKTADKKISRLGTSPTLYINMTSYEMKICPDLTVLMLTASPRDKGFYEGTGRVIDSINIEPLDYCVISKIFTTLQLSENFDDTPGAEMNITKEQHQELNKILDKLDGIFSIRKEDKSNEKTN